MRDSLHEAALRPMQRSGKGFWLLAGLFAALALWGLLAWIIQLTEGLEVAGYNDHAFWAIYEANLVAFIGVSYGGAVTSAVLRLTRTAWRAPIVRLAEATALFSLLMGMLFALVHLGRPERIWELVTRPNLTSPIFWDFAAVSTYLVATAIFLYLPLIPDLAALRRSLGAAAHTRIGRVYARLSLGWRNLPTQRRLLEGAMMLMAVLIIPLAVSVHSVLAWAFALTSRPGWHSTIFAPYFVIAALYSGVALVILVVAGFRRGYHLEAWIGAEHLVHLAYLMVALDAAYLYMTFADLFTEGYTMESSTVTMLSQLLAGKYALSFWLFVIVGGVLPLLLVALPWTRRTWGIVLAAAMAVFGLWLKRMLIVVPASTEPLVAGGWGSYHMTWVAAAITIGAAAAIPLLLMFFFRVFPVLAVDEMKHIAAETAGAGAMSEVMAR